MFSKKTARILKYCKVVHPLSSSTATLFLFPLTVFLDGDCGSAFFFHFSLEWKERVKRKHSLGFVIVPTASGTEGSLGDRPLVLSVGRQVGLGAEN